MGSQTENLLTVIDVGSAKTCVIVAEVNDYALRYRGHGIADSRGMRKGVIADLDKAVDSIRKAVEDAENVAQAPVEHAVVGVAGSHIRGVNSHGGIVAGSAFARDQPRRCAPGGGKGAQHRHARRPRGAAPASAGIHPRWPGWCARSCRADGHESSKCGSMW